MKSARPGEQIQHLAAYMAGQGMTQLQIAQALGITQTAVSRLVAAAEDAGYLARQSPFLFREELIDPEALKVLHQRGQKQHLDYLEHFAKSRGLPRAPTVRVLSVPERPIGARSTQEVIVARYREFTKLAAPYIRALLLRKSVRTCGVTWGYTLWDLCQAIQTISPEGPWKHESVDVIPLVGDPLQASEETPPSLTSSNIAAELGKTINGANYHAPWLGLVPAFIPQELDIAAIKKMLEFLPQHSEIFGNKIDALGRAGELDMLLTSVGPASRAVYFGDSRLLRNLGTQIEGMVFGDIGGVLLWRQPVQASPLMESIEERWTGLKRRHLEAIAEHARNDDPTLGRPGVVVLSIGGERDRAEMIREAVANGLVNYLLIDQLLEKSLKDLLGVNS
jgi:hypothetical protein